MLPGLAVAQETATPTEETAAPAEETTTETPAATEDTTPNVGEDGVPGELSLGVEEDNAVGTTYIKDTHGDWQVRCIRVAEGKEPCQLYQLLRDNQGNAVSEINIFALPAGQRVAGGANIVTPLETLLTQQLSVSVDGGPVKRYPFTWCSLEGCLVRVGFTGNDINAFRRGNKAVLTIVPVAAPDQKVELDMSLTGFTAGFEAMKAELAE